MPYSIAGLNGVVPLDSVAHVIQIALTPVFLLSGVATLLGVFNTCRARVADHSEHVAELLAVADGDTAARLRAHLVRLQHRNLALDVSVGLGAFAGAATCGAAFALFVGALHNFLGTSVLFTLFGVALTCTIGALMSFLLEGLLAWRGLRREGPLPRPKAVVKDCC